MCRVRRRNVGQATVHLGAVYASQLDPRTQFEHARSAIAALWQCRSISTELLPSSRQIPPNMLIEAIALTRSELPAIPSNLGGVG